MNFLSKKTNFGKLLFLLAFFPSLFTPNRSVANENSACPPSGTKTKAQINTTFGGNQGACMVTPDKYELTIFELGLCKTTSPIVGNAKTKSVNIEDNCVKTMESLNGVTADLAGGSNVQLPAAIGRPPVGTYDYAYIIVGKSFGIKGSYKLSDVTNTYTSLSNGNLDDSGNASVAHIDNLTSFGDNPNLWADGEDAEYGPQSMGTGNVSALLVNNSNERAANALAVTRLLGVFSANSGNKVTIDESSTGLQVELKIKDAGYMLFFDNSGVPTNAGSGPFVPEFTVF